jgi:CrcB protein
MAEVGAVFLGGALGTGARYGLDTLTLSITGVTFLGVMLINMVGAFTLGLLTGSHGYRSRVPNWMRAGLSVGVLGGFTTLSGVMLQSLFVGNLLSTLAFVFVSLLSSLLAAGLGLWLAKRASK